MNKVWTEKLQVTKIFHISLIFFIFLKLSRFIETTKNVITMRESPIFTKLIRLKNNKY